MLVDTSAFGALANKNDANRTVAGAIWSRLLQEGLIPFTTSFIVTETHALLMARIGHAVARTWLRSVPVREIWVTEEDYIRGRQIIEQHRDKAYSLADASAFAVMERLDTQLAFTFDQHFEQFGFQRLLPRS